MLKTSSPLCLQNALINSRSLLFFTHGECTNVSKALHVCLCLYPIEPASFVFLS